MKRRTIGPGVSFFAFQDIITAVVGIFILITLILVLELSQRVESASAPPPVDISEMKEAIESLNVETARLQAQYEERLNRQLAVANVNEINREAITENMTAEVQALSEQLAATEARTQRIQKQIEQEEIKEDELVRASQKLETQRNEIAMIKQRIEEFDEQFEKLEAHSGLIYRDTTDDGRALCILTLEESKIEMKDAATKSVQFFSGSNRLDELDSWLSSHEGGSRHFLVLVRPKGAGDFDPVQERLRQNNRVFGFDVVAEDYETELTFEWESQP